LPETVDPDAWLAHYDGRYYRRQVDSRGSIQLWKDNYYLGLPYAGQRCSVRLNAQTKSLQVELSGKVAKTLPLQGLYGYPIPFDDFLGLMVDEARSEWKEYLWRQPLKHAPKAS
jgi:hypothetical protein